MLCWPDLVFIWKSKTLGLVYLTAASTKFTISPSRAKLFCVVPSCICSKILVIFTCWWCFSWPCWRAMQREELMNPLTQLFQMMSSALLTSRHLSALWPRGLSLPGPGLVERGGSSAHTQVGWFSAAPETAPLVFHHGPEQQSGSPVCILDYSLIRTIGLTLTKEYSQFSYIYTAEAFSGNAMVKCWLHSGLYRWHLKYLLARLSPLVDLFQNTYVKTPYP